MTAAGAGAYLQEKNAGWVEKVLTLARQAAEMEAAIGFPRGKDGLGNPHYENGASILQVAIWNNFGTEKIPRRPFMVMATKRIHEEMQPKIRAVVKLINQGATDGKKELEKMAVVSQGIIQGTITDGEFAPNAQSTVEAKKSEHPLIDSGDMRKAVTWVVRQK